MVIVSVTTIARLERKVQTMAFEIPNGSVIEARINMTQNGQKMLNVWHYVANFSVAQDGDTVLQAVKDKIHSDDAVSVVGAYKSLASTSVVFVSGAAQVIKNTRSIAQYVAIGEAGVKDTDPLPQNVQMSATKHTDLAGRKFRGRMELAGLCLADQVAGTWIEGAVTQGEAVLTRIRTDIDIDDNPLNFLRPVIFHRDGSAVPTEWKSTVIQPTVRVARRRTVGVGK